MIALTWDRTWDLYIWALFTSPSGMNSALKIRRRKFAASDERMKSAKNENDNFSAMFCDFKVHFEASNSRLSRGLPSAAIWPPTMTY